MENLLKRAKIFREDLVGVHMAKPQLVSTMNGKHISNIKMELKKKWISQRLLACGHCKTR